MQESISNNNRIRRSSIHKLYDLHFLGIVRPVGWE